MDANQANHGTGLPQGTSPPSGYLAAEKMSWAAECDENFAEDVQWPAEEKNSGAAEEGGEKPAKGGQRPAEEVLCRVKERNDRIDNAQKIEAKKSEQPKGAHRNDQAQALQLQDVRRATESRNSKHVGNKPIPLMSIEFPVSPYFKGKLPSVKKSNVIEQVANKPIPLMEIKFSTPPTKAKAIEEKRTERSISPNVGIQSIPQLSVYRSKPTGKTDGRLSGNVPFPYASQQRKPYKFSHFTHDNFRASLSTAMRPIRGKEQSEQKVPAKDAEGDKARNLAKHGVEGDQTRSFQLSGNARDLARTADQHGSQKNQQVKRPDNKELAKGAQVNKEGESSPTLLIQPDTYRGTRFAQDDIRGTGISDVFDAKIRCHYAARYYIGQPTFLFPLNWSIQSNVVAVYKDYFDNPFNAYHDRRQEISEPPVVVCYKSTKEEA
jgi:hypothetical protein